MTSGNNVLSLSLFKYFLYLISAYILSSHCLQYSTPIGSNSYVREVHLDVRNKAGPKSLRTTSKSVINLCSTLEDLDMQENMTGKKSEK